MTPQRIQRKRAKGWRMPEGAVYVGRPSTWGNMFAHGNRAAVTEMYQRWLNPAAGYTILDQRGLILRDAPKLLRGKDLACWCPLDEPCHADVLLEIANAPDGEQEKRDRRWKDTAAITTITYPIPCEESKRRIVGRPTNFAGGTIFELTAPAPKHP